MGRALKRAADLRLRADFPLKDSKPECARIANSLLL
jgi:hypothetical protein